MFCTSSNIGTGLLLNGKKNKENSKWQELEISSYVQSDTFILPERETPRSCHWCPKLSPLWPCLDGAPAWRRAMPWDGCMDLPLEPGEPSGWRLCYQHCQQCTVLTLPLEGRAAPTTAPLLSVWVAPSKAAQGWEEGGCPPLTTGQLPTRESRRGFAKDPSFWLPQHAESTKPRTAVNPFKQYLAR